MKVSSDAEVHCRCLLISVTDKCLVNKYPKPVLPMTLSRPRISINGRILPTPSIYYGSTASSKPVVRPGRHEARYNNALILNPQVPRNGSWNVVNQTIHEPKTLKAWGVLNYSNVRAATIDRFVGTLINVRR